MHIWTDSPIDELWNQLRYFASPANVGNLLVGRIQSKRQHLWSSTDADKQKYEIASCIRQADEYFRASRGVGLATKPLLQFYGAQALAKALILANDSSVSLADLRYHGLSTRASTAEATEQQSLQLYSDDPRMWNLEAEYAVTNEGVFPHLARVSGDTVPPRGKVLRFKDLLRIVPDLADRFVRHYGEPSHCLYLYSEPKLDNDQRWSVYFSPKDGPNILKVFPELSSGFDTAELHGHPGVRSVQAISEIPSFGVLEMGTVAGRYLVRPHACGIAKSPTVLYAAMLILSNVVRYKPAFWMSVIDGQFSGSASIAEGFTNMFARRFPADVLEGLWHERFTFAGAAYLS